MKAQEWLDKYYPKNGTFQNKEDWWEAYHNLGKRREEIKELRLCWKSFSGSLDLSDFISLEKLDCSRNQLTSLDLTNCAKLTELDCWENNLTNLILTNCLKLEKISGSNNNFITLNISQLPALRVLQFLECKITTLNLNDNPCLSLLLFSDNKLTNLNFLTRLSNPEKILCLDFSNNNIQSTDIEIFSRLANTKTLRFGTEDCALNERGKLNKFYGSFQSLKNLTKLETLCADKTDVDSGLEYLPSSLKKLYCFSNTYLNTDTKCKAIQDELRPFDYDLEAWQLAHPEKMLISRPELFTNLDSKDKWIQALDNKVGKSQRELLMTKLNEPDKTKRIERLESKVQNLTQVKETLEKSTQTDLFTTADKPTQTKEEEDHPKLSQTTTIPSKLSKSRAEKEVMIMKLLKELQEEDEGDWKVSSKSFSYRLENGRFIKTYRYKETIEQRQYLKEQPPKK